MRKRLLATALACCVCAWILLTSRSSGQDAVPAHKPAHNDQHVLPHRQSSPPNKPYSPEESLRRMTVPDGFEIQLVAAEPDIVNPIAMCFDDRGRILITESVEYPRKPAGPGRDRIKLLEGFREDGYAAKVTTFAEGLNIPTGIAVGYGGVWVLNAPDLLFMTEKDGREATREVVLTGFGRADTHELPNSLTWGPDGWLYGLNGVFNPSRITDKDGKRHDFTCAMWRLHPRTRQFQVFAQGTSNPYGIAWDSEGSAIIEACHWANDHLFHFVETGYYTRQAGAYPPFTFRIGSITDHGHQKTAYCGIVNLDSDVFPAQYRDRILVGNIHGGCINVDRLERDGATYLAREEPDLLTANDAWFMPVSLKIGPDGCLYILDWHDRYHCSQDAARDPEGVDRRMGRLYRLSYGKVPHASPQDLAGKSDRQLITYLSSDNVHHRESAQRILAEQLSHPKSPPAPALAAELQRVVFEDAASRKGRLHALWALIGGGPLDAEFHQRLLSHPDATFRAWAVRSAGDAAAVPPAVRDRVISLARDPSPDVQLQVAIASRKMTGVDALAVLSEVLAHCGQDKLIPAIVWPNLHPLLEADASRFITLITKGQALPPAASALSARIVDRILASRTPDAKAVAQLLEYLARTDTTRLPESIAAISSRTDGWVQQRLAPLRQHLRPVIEQLLAQEAWTSYRLSLQMLAARLDLARVDAEDIRRRFSSPTEAPAVRLQALDALIAFRDSDLLKLLPEVLSSADYEQATRILAALGHVDDPKLADVLLELYPRFRPELQPLAIDLLLQREPWARKLLDGVLAEKLPRGVLNANHLRKIMDSNDREAIWAVEKAFGQVREERNPEREKVVAEMGEHLRKHPGDPAAGQKVFANLCAQCHRIYGQGGDVGPDITANGRASFDQLLSNIFDPSLVIGPAYQVTTVVTRDGRNLTGLVVEASDQRAILRLPGGGQEIIPRNNVKYTRLSKLSMMPEGIETLLDRKDLADLFAFLSLDKPPSDPAAKLIPGAPAPR